MVVKGYIYAVGRRKTASAQVRMTMDGKGDAKVAGRELVAYFGSPLLSDAVISPLKAVGLDGKVNLDIRINGGGLRGQSEAARHGVARALIKFNPDYRPSLKKLGFLTRDPREKERKKYGLKKARKGPQWAKR